jgi:ATP-dependent RNA helicase DeaD
MRKERIVAFFKAFFSKKKSPLSSQKVVSAFRKLPLSPEMIEALEKKGFEEPTPIQETVIPVIMNESCDIVGQAQTGTGKTAAFGVPLLEKLQPHGKNVQALVLVPTRELAIQVSQEISSLKGRKPISVCPVYGGQSIEMQIRQLRRGVDIVVGTPGRIIDHLNRGTLKLDQISYLVLDEADEMLNMGFLTDVEYILSHTNRSKRVLLFSATMPEPILNLARNFMHDYKYLAVKKDQLTTSLADQIWFEVDERDKLEALCRIIDAEQSIYGLVFCRTKNDTAELARRLMDRGYDVEALHGDISQQQREKVLDRFKRRKISLLIATDIAARGIDISNLTHVINFSLPQDPESYVHRIGRTGRAGKQGKAITFVTPEEYRKLASIKAFANTEIKKQALPKVDEILQMRRARIMKEINQTMQKGFSDMKAFADELIAKRNPRDVVAALLKHFYSKQLDPGLYDDISGVGVDDSGTTRLFVAMGRNRNMQARDIVQLIERESGVPASRIQDVVVRDNFSFITVPFKEAELIIEAFQRKKTGSRSLVERAKPSQGRPSRGGRYR